MRIPPDLNIALELVRVTEAAALAAGKWIGKGQKISGDGAAVEIMRYMLSTVTMNGKIIIGEGEKDEAPMLFTGEKVGNGKGPLVDVAVDPVEGTSLLANGRQDSISVIAVSPKDTMWNPGPAFYMKKLVVGKDAAKVIKPELLNQSPEKIIRAVAKAKRTSVENITVFILDKPRHQSIIKEIQRCGARVMSRTDGDVAGGFMALFPESGVDIMMGIGGTPEGVITACAVRALGGAMLGQLAPQKDDEKKALEKSNIDMNKIFTEKDLIKSDDVFFAATGITDGLLLQGVHYKKEEATTESIVIRGKTGTIRRIHSIHNVNKLKVISGNSY